MALGARRVVWFFWLGIVAWGLDGVVAGVLRLGTPLAYMVYFPNLPASDHAYKVVMVGVFMMALTKRWSWKTLPLMVGLFAMVEGVFQASWVLLGYAGAVPWYQAVAELAVMPAIIWVLRGRVFLTYGGLVALLLWVVVEVVGFLTTNLYAPDVYAVWPNVLEMLGTLAAMLVIGLCVFPKGSFIGASPAGVERVVVSESF